MSEPIKRSVSGQGATLSEPASTATRAVAGVVIGGVCWLAFGYFAVSALGAGDGIVFPFVLLWAPFYSGPAAWCLIGALSANNHRPRPRRVLIVLLPAFYLAVGLWAWSQQWAMGEGPFFTAYGGRFPSDLEWLAMIFYTAPHLWVWGRLIAANRRRRSLT